MQTNKKPPPLNFLVILRGYHLKKGLPDNYQCHLILYHANIINSSFMSIYLLFQSTIPDNISFRFQSFL